MNSKTKENIIKLNSEFYKAYEKSFDKNRKSRNWGGVDNFFDIGEIPIKPLILDLACGNGRILKKVKAKFGTSFSYKGVDNNQYLLNKAQILADELLLSLQTEFINGDVFKKWDFAGGKFDIVLALGITHHIPSVELRNLFFTNISNLLKKDGFALISFWSTKKQNTVYEIPSKNIQKKDLDEGDRFFGWGQDDSLYRYYHFYSLNELKQFINTFRTNNCSLYKTYDHKEFKNNVNKYFIFKKDL